LFTGKEGSLPFGRENETPSLATEERIAHILTEAASMMTVKQGSEDQNSHEEDSKSPNCPSPLSVKDGQRRIKKYENDDIPQEKVARIYQEELAKLVTRGQGNVYPPRYPMRPGTSI